VLEEKERSREDKSASVLSGERAGEMFVFFENRTSIKVRRLSESDLIMQRRSSERMRWEVAGLQSRLDASQNLI
jgi:hypothetical protein